MTYPIPNYTRVWVRGRIIDLGKAALQEDNYGLALPVTFSPSPKVLLNAGTGQIISTASFKITPAAQDGYFAIQLPATDDPDINPTNFTYSVKEPTGRSYNIIVPAATPLLNSPGDPLHGQPVLDLITIVPSPPAGAGSVQLLTGTPGRGIVSTDNVAGDLVITYTDSTTQNLGPVSGGASSLSELDDVNTAGAAVGQVVVVTEAGGKFGVRWPAVAQHPALGKLVAGLTSRATAPCRIAFAGSSTTVGSNASSAANRYVNRLVAAIQAAYPSGLGTESAVVTSNSATWGTLSSAVGVHGYNAGEGGTLAATYLTGGEIANVAALNPAAVIHMIGSNDFKDGVPVATYKANVQSVINQLKAAMTAPCVHILVHPYERFDAFTPVAAWAAYGAALAAIAAADPDNVVFVDIGAPYYALGVPGADPRNLIDTDNLHQTDAGHALMAELLARTLGIPGPRQPATASAATSTRTLARITSDGPTGADAADVVGRTSDALLGGAGKAWVGDATGLAISSGALVRGALNANWFAGWAEPTADVEVSFVIAALPSAAGAITADVHRTASSAAGGSSVDAYRLSVSNAGTATLTKRVATVTSNISAAVPYVVGDRLAIRWYKGTLELRINGELRAAVVDNALPSKGYVGFSGSAAATGFSLTNVTLDVVT